jgi:hypothetical protein
MFRASSCPSSEATTTAVAASGLPSGLGDSSAVGRGRADLRICCIWFVDSVDSMMMHGLVNPKKEIHFLSQTEYSVYSLESQLLFCGKHMKDTNTQCEKNTELFNVKFGDIHIYH